MLTVHKFAFLPNEELVVPGFVKLLSLGFQEAKGSAFAWALVDTDKSSEVAKIKMMVKGTGLEIRPEELEGMKFFATFMFPQGELIFHVWVPETINTV